MIKLMIADHHAIMRKGLKQLFALDGDMQAWPKRKTLPDCLNE